MKVLLVALAFVGLTAALPQSPLPHKNVAALFPGQCKVCTDAVDALEVLLQAFGPEEKEITDFVEGLCADLPLFGDQCKLLVDTIIDYIDQNDSPTDICDAIKACPEAKKVVKKAAPVEFPGQCKVCTDAVDALEVLLQAFGPEEPTVKKFVEDLCGKLPLFGDQCKQLVDTVIGYIDQNDTPADICNAINVCPEAKKVIEVAPVEFPGQCQVCTDAVDALEVLLQAFGPEEKEVVDFIEGICADLPLFGDQCKLLVDTIVGYIDQNDTPADICDAMKVCPDPTKKVVKKVANLKFPGQCRVCTDAVDALEVLLKAFGPEEKIITDFAEAICAKLPLFGDQCKLLVDTIINYIDQNDSPQDICSSKDINACPEPEL